MYDFSEMLFGKVLLGFSLLHLVNPHLQINLYLTHWTSDDDNLQHDCLHVPAFINDESDPYQIIPYCMGTLPSKFPLKDNYLDQKFTFAQLSEQNITSEQLYRWSAPIDVVEQYQFYLNEHDKISEKEVFYNCTPPCFGSQCQYVLHAYQSHHSSLNEIIHEYYRYNRYEPTLLTCYTHLECNRGVPPSCLDWTEICDEKVDCLDGGYDEEHCWQLDINQCDADEYGCYNGQCISKPFLHDDPNFPDCLDQSDGSFTELYVYDEKKHLVAEPIFRSEDVLCPVKVILFRDSNQLTLSCVRNRQNLLSQALFSIKAESISDECWSALKCVIELPVQADSINSALCDYTVRREIISKTCPDIIYAPTVPILFGHIYSAFEKTRLLEASPLWQSEPAYLCYNETLLYVPNDSYTITLPPNKTCRSYMDMIHLRARRGVVGWLPRFIEPVVKWLRWKTISIHENSRFLNNSMMYQCLNSSKFISKHKLFNEINDCFAEDDENFTQINRTCSTEQNPDDFKCLTTNECIPRKLVGDRFCHCTKYDGNKCNDEDIDYFYAQNYISFQTICDGHSHLIPRILGVENETDETDCDHWSPIHIYNRCDGFWDISDASVEINCDSPPLSNCSSNHHICVSPRTNELICLSMEKVGDGIVDCLGAADEPTLCQSYFRLDSSTTFYCSKNSDVSCVGGNDVCDKYPSPFCDNEEQQVCRSEELSKVSDLLSVCTINYESDGSDAEKVLCRRFYRTPFRERVYFTLDQRQDLIQRKSEQENSLPDSSLERTIQYYQQRCHRGLDLQVWLDKSKNYTTNTCLCPPSYYGDICQYQNQRISLTLQFNVTSDSFQTPFLIVVSLIDDTNERIIHSYEQLTYLSLQHCRRKFNVYLLYSARPKDETKGYSIHIDAYEKITLDYRGSFIKSLKFPFLPVHRVGLKIDILRFLGDCLDNQCRNGKCRVYLNDPTNRTFCQCKNGWSGQYCTIQHTSVCSSDSLSMGKLANNRSLCICPVNKIGPRCLINDVICQNNESVTCLNGGRCISIDEYGASGKNFLCICSRGFTGDQCEIAPTQLMLTFDKNITLSSFILIHFIETKLNDIPVRTTTFKMISYGQTSTTVFWSLPFHLAFVELSNNTYYLVHLQKIYNESSIINKTLNSLDRCLHISELFNQSIANSSLIRRIKYYHLPCRTNSSELNCFYDDIHLCLCQSIGQHQRVANCFEFDHHMNFSSSAEGCCENGGECFEEQRTCPRVAVCKCPKCYYGSRCQLSTNGFSLSLDAILNYHIRPNVNLSHQPWAVLISLILTIIITLLGLANGVLSLITFQNKTSRKSGCGIYLLSSSVTVLLTMIVFLLKFTILLLSQMGTITNRSFLTIQCYSIDFLLRFSLTMDQWLTAFVAVERVFIVRRGVHFNSKKFKSTAKRMIVVLVLIAIVTNIHDPIHRRLFAEGDNDEQRLWCIAEYSSTIRLLNQLINILHFILPFVINFISALVIIIKSAQQQAAIKKKQSYKNILKEQIQQHKNLLIGPCVLIILAIPRLIISFTSGCLESASGSWLFLVGYFISLIPSLLTFILFVLPSSTYKQAFREGIKHYRNFFRRR